MQWTTSNPKLAVGEYGLETDTGKCKVGDGVQAWKDLPYDLTKAVADELYATKRQGSLAESAVQPDDVGSAAKEDSSTFATAIQGSKADTAVQPGDITDLSITQGMVIDRLDTHDSWIANRGGLLDTVVGDAKFPSAMKVSAPSGAYTQVSRLISFDVSSGFLSFWIKPLNEDLERVGVALSVGSTNFSSRLEVGNTASGAVVGRWNRVTVPLAALGRNGSPQPTYSQGDDVRAVRFEVFSKSGAQANVLLSDLRVFKNPLPPGLVWWFDDGRADTYTEAFPILQSHGIRGGIAVETGRVGESGRCSLLQLQEMHAEGWQLTPHTHTGGGLSTTDLASVRSRLQESRDWIVSNGFDEGANHFVYPGGVHNAMIRDEVAKHFTSARTAGGQGFETIPAGDPYRLRPYYFTTGVTLSSAKAALDRARDAVGIIYLTFHSLVETPVATEDWSIDDFTELVSYASTQGLRDYLPRELW